ncbi:YafY family protein [Arthrobacter sp. B1805]|uniref:helix-turn-helix transcriptional regulator n=1 Tax=Arthrobacter sp. B1805 TaxID=2058892 RepID=UPI0015E45203|nr:WYL domain-containing protein [Arthrobacter sp. B1805]
MWDTSERLLKLLSLLQRHEGWSADALCEELAVTSRTISRDVVRLRNLGYPVITVKGIGGGYTLEKGAVLPPVMFSVDEATAVLLALRHASDVDAGASGHAATALEKLHQVLPRPVRAGAKALAAHTTTIDLGQPITPDAPTTDAWMLVLLSRSCRSRRQVTCTYRHHGGTRRARQLEPLHLVHTMKRWYLLAYCLQDDDWAILRVDRMADVELTALTSQARQPPSEDLDGYVGRAVSRGWQRVTATVRVHAPRADVAHWISPAWGTVVEETPRTCIVDAGADSYESIARWLLLTGRDITVIAPPALAQAFGEVADQAARTARRGR